MKRKNATSIKPSVKLTVYERDHGCCIFCHRAGDPVAHVINRSQGGLGVEQNIVTACFKCHTELDNGKDTKERREYAINYLKSKYPGWTRESVTYRKGL